MSAADDRAAMRAAIDQALAASIEAKRRFAAEAAGVLAEVAERCAEAIRQGHKLLLFGNGGSAADAQHVAAEFVNRFLIDRRPLPAIALATDTSIITSIGNDFSFDDIFAKQVQALGQAGDVAIGISTSGNSPNVVRAIDRAREGGLVTVAFTGEGGGRLASRVDFLLAVPSRHTPAIQETHLWAEHLLCQLVDHLLFGGRSRSGAGQA